MRELISHPPSKGKSILLENHLKEVADRCAELLRSRSLNLSFPQEELIKAGFITGICHDFGKAKDQFQRYIWGEGRLANQYHSLISSLFTFLVAEELFKDKKGPLKFLPFICAYAVNRHHGILINPEEAFSADGLDLEFKIAKGSLDKRIWNFCFALPELTVEFQNYREKFLDCEPKSVSSRIRDFDERLYHLAGRPQAGDSWLMDLYFALLLIISSLTAADRVSVVGVPGFQISARILPDAIKKYAFSQPQAPSLFQMLRERAWKEIEDFGQQDFSLRLTLPTGMGKTLMGLYLSARMGGGQIIYALPYLSIIEQTTQVCQALFPSNSVIQHHSLSFPQRKHEKEVLSFEQARLYLESWNAELVVTTFDQLFYSFLSPERSFIQRFSCLPEAVLILDEVQTLPARLIPAIQIMLHKASEKLGTKILYMTATHPPFLKTQPVLNHERGYFQGLSRTKLLLNLKQPLPFSEYLNDLEGWPEQQRGKNILFVANTIRSSLGLWDHLSALRENEGLEDMKLFYLSGNVVPVHRLERIQQIKRLLKTESWLVIVSTQCVEAGVDIDMDQIIRDFAPWDSIMQICGRANRFGKNKEASIYIYRWLDNSSNREFHRYIYDPILTDATLDVLEDYSEVSETDFLDIQDQYVQILEKRLGGEETKELLKNALAWRFEELDFRKLFRGTEGWKVSLLCIADKTAERLKDIAVFWSAGEIGEALKNLQGLWDDSLLSEPLARFLRITPKEMRSFINDLKEADERSVRYHLPYLLSPLFQAYTISLPVRSVEEIKGKIGQIREGFPYIPREHYDAARGFSPEKDDRLLSNII